jgi:hypothetical protein
MSDAEVAAAEATLSRGRVTTERYDADALRTALPQWPDLPKRQRLAVLRLLEPVDVTTTTNTPCKGQHELLATYLCRAENSDATASHLAVGSDNGTSPAYTNESINNEGYRPAVTDSSLDDTTVVSTTFLDATEANDLDSSTSENKIREVGLVTDGTVGEGELLNHALVDPTDKNSSTAVTITVELSWEAA